ncbi:cytidine deaminase [Croceivirga thetidis]|uniref:Cytidine deaminase n=1 Tax=Croceivirga thetidis TaxID=2721623 RepID=A0ABX1GX56_9FLAO|nr:cytidine deaminase [Croceivirga thetidis]NKI33297.1 cytidine deaminase [Croceivirga thetidis]
MVKKKIGFELEVYQSTDELPKELVGLLEKAEEIRNKAYAPYSNFQVGAAVLLQNGEIVLGNNQENASYPSGLCAERVAIFHAGANFPNQTITAIAISAASKEYLVDRPAGPCGNCRQAISEYETKQKSPIRLILRGEKGDIFVVDSMTNLLPLGFDNSFLFDS